MGAGTFLPDLKPRDQNFSPVGDGSKPPDTIATERWMEAAYDLTTPNGSMWLNLGYMDVAQKGRAVPIPYLLWDKSRFFLQQEVTIL